MYIGYVTIILLDRLMVHEGMVLYKITMNCGHIIMTKTHCSNEL